MLRPFCIFVLFSLILYSCTKTNTSVLSAFDVYCEMVANDAKPMALHYPMYESEVDNLWNSFLEIANKHEVEIHRENQFPRSLLFPSTLTEGKTVVLIYRGERLKQYQLVKQDLESMDVAKPIGKEIMARRLGRLLGYSTQGINQLLSKNSNYQNLTSYGVLGQVTHLYYADPEEANNFYQDILGLSPMYNNRYQISEDAYIAIHSLNAAHPADQAKSTAIALLTDQLSDWYTHLQEKKVTIKYTYKPKSGGPHDGFVAIDPGGYLLEFEQFKQHPENELLMAILSNSQRVETAIGALNFYGSITWTYHKDLLKMQQFYEEILGYELVADQGWTKIYQTSKAGFIGLVDERRGMEDYAEKKAVEIEWWISEIESFNDYADQFWTRHEQEDSSYIGPEQYKYIITNMEPDL